MIGGFFLVGIIVASLAGCEFEVSVTTASLSEATMCKSVDPETQQPIEKADVFAPDTPVIYCSVKLSNAPPYTQVKAQWIYIKGELDGVQDQLIGEFSINAEGNRYIGFSLEQPTNGWPRGDYTVKLFLNDKEKITVPFKVE